LWATPGLAVAYVAFGVATSLEDARICRSPLLWNRNAHSCEAILEKPSAIPATMRAPQRSFDWPDNLIPKIQRHGSIRVFSTNRKIGSTRLCESCNNHRN